MDPNILVSRPKWVNKLLKLEFSEDESRINRRYD